ncbi:Tm-1-like ATP-binding domain-containing protein [Natrarchaeobius sp. A-rgal3]|uniref:Tm-1-like ATP-binding domain-containing protein n=1 Tax=Natrarchaeobius versutus TaxID=1679078 RepID=UPI0035101DEF
MAVVIVGTLDTKGEEIGFATDILESHGVDVHVVDVGVVGDPEHDPDTSASEVAEAADTTLQHLREAADRGEAMESMGDGAATIARRLHDEGRLEGVLGLGGSGNTSVATTAMRALPVGVPKVMVSTVASGDVEPYVGGKDVMMVHSVADIEGINRLTQRVIANSVLAMVGMVRNDPAVDIEDEPTVAISMFGVTTPCVQAARDYLEEQGYETIVFHATGAGGRALEDLVRQGIIDGVLDVTTTEWADELVGGVLSAGPDRLDAAAETGTPQVVSVGALDMVNFGPRESVPGTFEGRTFHEHNPAVTLMRTTATETEELGRIISEKLSRSRGATALYLPLEGVSMLDVEGEVFHDPEADTALFETLRETIDDTVELVEYETEINDERFAVAMAKRLDEYMSTTNTV